MTKWKLVPAEQFADLMFRLEQLESNGALPYQLEGMAAAIEAAPPPQMLSDERIDKLCDIVERDNVLFSQSGIYALARAIERDILGGNE